MVDGRRSSVYHTDCRHPCTTRWREAARRAGLSATGQTDRHSYIQTRSLHYFASWREVTNECAMAHSVSAIVSVPMGLHIYCSEQQLRSYLRTSLNYRTLMRFLSRFLCMSGQHHHHHHHQYICSAPITVRTQVHYSVR